MDLANRAEDDSEPVDLLEQLNQVPSEVRKVCEYHIARLDADEGDPYKLCAEFLQDVEQHGYTFDYGLDGVPVDLQPKPGFKVDVESLAEQLDSPLEKEAIKPSR